MKLNKNSVGVKIYQYVWGEDLPNNLCNYFWKSVLAYPLIPLVTVLQLMYYPASLIPLVKREMEGDRFSERLAGLLSVIITYLLFAVGVFISSAFVTYQADTFMYVSYVFGGILTISTSFLFIYLLALRFFDKKENMFREYIKAKKGNYCPKIEWEDEK